MRKFLPGLVVGVIFGAGLALSDMFNPARVLAFLDIAGAWDPTLAYVMGSALIPSAIAYRIRQRMARPLLAPGFAIPENRQLDRPLLLGGAMFGIGWGLVGLCPGPALAGLVLGTWQIWLFAAAMLAGMLLHHFVTQTRAPAHSLG
ncbi:MAG: YeeE/YedE family protein [Alphaproteobacteria bacterium]|nr:YeeE/YedE family protein [Alphaproteobacteria bacterium]